MSLFNPHDPDRLAALAAGTLSPGRRQRALAHVRGCPQCAQHYERLVLAERALAGGRAHEPSPTELASLKQANRAAVLAAARGEKPAAAAWSLPPWLPALGLTAVGVIAIVLFRPPPQDTFAPRGEAQSQPAAELRLFCARPDRPLVELAPHITCPPGATLAFAARFANPPPTAVLEITGGGSPERVELKVDSAPGEEKPLGHTVVLQLPGTREVVLTAGDRVLRRSVRVEPDR